METNFQIHVPTFSKVFQEDFQVETVRAKLLEQKVFMLIIMVPWRTLTSIDRDVMHLLFLRGHRRLGGGVDTPVG